MKNPTILMNENDFKVFKKELESKTTVVVGDNPTYEGVPIKINNIIQSGNIVVYDYVSVIGYNGLYTPFNKLHNYSPFLPIYKKK